MSYDERLVEERELAIKEKREPRYLQPTTVELREFLMTGELYGKCLKCKVFGRVKVVEDRYRCEACGA